MAILVKGEHALCANQVHGLLSIREGVLNADVVVLLHSVKELICLLVQTTSIETA